MGHPVKGGPFFISLKRGVCYTRPNVRVDATNNTTNNTTEVMIAFLCDSYGQSILVPALMPPKRPNAFICNNAPITTAISNKVYASLRVATKYES